MFRDLKEYQEFRKLYEEQVYSTDLDKTVERIFLEENFTDEELQYVHENIDVLIQDHLSSDGDEFQDLNEVIGKLAAKTATKLLSKGGGKVVQKGLSKGAGGLASRMSSGFAKNVSKIPVANRLGGSGAITKATGAAGGALSKFKNVASKLKDKAGKLIKKGVDFAKKNKPAVGGGAALGALAAGGGIKRALDRRAAINKQELSQKDPDDPTSKRNTGAPEATRTVSLPIDKSSTPKQTTQPAQQAKPKKMGEIERRNRQRFGDKRIDMLKQKQKDFKSMDRAEFRKKYPKSQSAKDAAARKRRPSVMDYESYKPDAYDVVLEYLLSSQQAATIEEANYIMTEMDAKTIQDIVAQQLNEQN